jgi:DNA-binding protein YbaB
MQAAQAAGPSDDLGVLRQQAQALQQQLDQIQSRIAALEVKQ